MSENAELERVSIREGLFAGELSDLDTLALVGCACSECEEVALGEREFCANCGSNAVASIPLSKVGTLWTFTVSRHQPPGNYRGPEPFEPFGLGLVELPEGIRVMTPLRGRVEELEIGLPARFVPYVRRDETQEVVEFTFAVEGKGSTDV